MLVSFHRQLQSECRTVSRSDTAACILIVAESLRGNGRIRGRRQLRGKCDLIPLEAVINNSSLSLFGARAGEKCLWNNRAL